jgi:hypothetical protein
MSRLTRGDQPPKMIGHTDQHRDDLYEIGSHIARGKGAIWARFTTEAEADAFRQGLHDMQQHLVALLIEEGTK